MLIKLKKFLENVGFECGNCKNWDKEFDPSWGHCKRIPYCDSVDLKVEDFACHKNFCCSEFEGRENEDKRKMGEMAIE